MRLTVGRLLRAIVLGKGHNGVIGVAAGILALVALVVGSAAGNVGVHAHVRGLLIASCCAAAIVVFGVIATTRISAAVGHLAFLRTVPSAGVAVRIFISGVGYLICAFSVLAVLNVGVGKLLVGAGLAGVVLGIAAQPSLGNVFAGIVLVLAHPFTIGDRVRIRSGALGGVFDAAVIDLGLAYVTLQTDDGVLRIPNSAMLAAGVLQLTPASAPLPPTTVVAVPAGAGGGGAAGVGAGPGAAGAGPGAAGAGPVGAAGPGGGAAPGWGPAAGGRPAGGWPGGAASGAPHGRGTAEGAHPWRLPDGAVPANED